MSQSMSLSPAESLASLCRSLLPASQETLVQFARFLKAQETASAFDAVDEEDEAEWDRLFQDDAKVAAFTREVDASMARSKPQPLDPARL
jgi:hypothetical protein